MARSFKMCVLSLYFILNIWYNPLYKTTIKEGITMVDGKAIIRSVMAKKNIKISKLAEMLGDNRQTLANTLQYNKMTLNKFAEIADALGCDVLLADRDTGETFKLV